MKKIKSNQDFPRIIINSIPAKELTGLNVRKADLREYIDGLKQLEHNSPDFIVMVCNTVHLYLDALRGEIKTEILDLRTEVIAALRRKRAKSMTVLGTPATMRGRLYVFSGIKDIPLKSTEVLRISSAISRFNAGIESERQSSIIKEIAKSYSSRSDTVIAGCTEISLMLQGSGIPCLDTMDVLVEATIRKLEEVKLYGK